MCPAGKRHLLIRWSWQHLKWKICDDNDHQVLDDQNDYDYDDHQDAQLADEWFWIVIGGRPTTGHCGEPSHWNLTRGLWKIILIVHNLVIILIFHNLGDYHHHSQVGDHHDHSQLGDHYHHSPHVTIENHSSSIRLVKVCLLMMLNL